MSNPQIVLHWYPASPFAQKIAWALQYKNVPFKSVIITPTEPRPLRRPLDAGYRKTPILQIGNHTFCDSRSIFAELEKRFPEPTLYPEGSEALSVGLGRWTDSALFTAAVSQIPFKIFDKEFVKDRESFNDKSINPDAAAFAAPYLVQSLKAELELINAIVKEKSKDGELFSLGTKTLSLFDLKLSMNLWFLTTLRIKIVQQNFPVLDKILKKTLAAVRYAEIKKVPTITAEEALQIAKEGSWESEKAHDGSLNIPLGQLVTVTPTDSGKTPSVGILVHSTIQETVIKNEQNEYGFTSYTHYPVVGFVVLPKNSKL